MTHWLERIFVIARSVSDEAIQSISLDCFAPLAKTSEYIEM
jgi:hypothetical protein